MIETTTSEESSGFWTSHDEEDEHIRKDGGSSAEEENRLKDFVRRNAREERDAQREAEAKLKQKEKDFKLIERMRFEKLPIPQDMIQKYGDELTEANYNLPRQFLDSQSAKL